MTSSHRLKSGVSNRGKKNGRTKKIRIIVILNHLKNVINPAFDNDIYQLWLETDKKVKFRSWCIDKIKEQILQELDEVKPNSSYQYINWYPV